MKLILNILHVFIGLSIFSTAPLLAQNDTSKSIEISANVDLMSRYIWRGQEYGQAPSIQPDISFTWKGFSLGSWGAYKFTGEGLQETDFYLSQAIGPLTFAVWDYYSFYDTSASDFFDYKQNRTSHLLEAQIWLEGNEKIPFNLLGSYFFYGDDPSKSIYVELQYIHQIEQTEILVFAGFQPKGSYYAPKAAFVNLGCTVARPIQLTNEFLIPLSVSLIMNPDLKSTYLVAGISL